MRRGSSGTTFATNPSAAFQYGDDARPGLLPRAARVRGGA